MGGAEALQHILARDPDVKAVMTTGYSETIDAGEFRKYGFVEAMLKPFDILELVQTVSRICS